MPKSSKRFVISDSSINEYDFRILTSGVDLTQYLKNPIVLWMHIRAWRGTKDEVLPIGTMTDIAIEGDQIFGTPVFDDNDEFAMTIYNKVESDILKMCSGGFKILTWSDEAQYILPGQKRASAIKSVLKEVSICDLGANNNALSLYDENDEVINLSDKTTLDIIPLLNTKQEMTVELKDVAAKLKLADATPEAILTAVENMQKENSDLKTENTNLKAAQVKSEMDAELKTAVNAGKITAAQIPKYEKLAEGRLDVLKELLNDMPAHQSIQSQLTDNSGKDEVETLRKMSWDELDQKDLLSKLKDKDFDAFKLKYKEQFGKDWQEKK